MPARLWRSLVRASRPDRCGGKRGDREDPYKGEGKGKTFTSVLTLYVQPSLGTHPLRRCRGGDRLRGRRGLRLRLRLGSSGSLPLHVDAAAEVGAFGNRNARSDDVPVDRAIVADIDLLAR